MIPQYTGWQRSVIHLTSSCLRLRLPSAALAFSWYLTRGYQPLSVENPRARLSVAHNNIDGRRYRHISDWGEQWGRRVVWLISWRDGNLDGDCTTLHRRGGFVGTLVSQQRGALMTKCGAGRHEELSYGFFLHCCGNGNISQYTAQVRSHIFEWIICGECDPL